jgi:SPW repeat
VARAAFTPPRQWQDWVSWMLGIWLSVSPWALGFANDALSTQNAVVVGFLLILTEVVTLSIFETWEEWINVALGAWLIVSPWGLAMVSVVARANCVTVGLIVVVLTLYELWQARQADTASASKRDLPGEPRG